MADDPDPYTLVMALSHLYQARSDVALNEANVLARAGGGVGNEEMWRRHAEQLATIAQALRVVARPREGSS